MNGSNNPTVRARMEYGKEKYKDLQSYYKCDKKELVLSSGGLTALSSRVRIAR